MLILDMQVYLTKLAKPMMHTFDFTTQGNHYNFNQKDNPSYKNHKAVAFLTLSKDKFLEWDTIDMKFKFNNKTYQFKSNLASITRTFPFMIKGIQMNKYCKGAYFAVINNPKQLDSTPVLSISPTGKDKNK